MMFKRRVLLVILLGFFMIIPVENVKASNGYLLLLYDSYKSYGSEINTLDKVIKMSLSTGNRLLVRKIDRYTKEEVQGAEGVIIISNDRNKFSEEMIIEASSLNSNIIYLGEFLRRDINSINLENLSGIEELELRKIILDRFSNKVEKNNNSYLLLDEMYPFDDFNLIVDKVNYLYEKGIPFLVEAMPVFQNVHSDAMKRYAEVLRYCQSKGGRIIFGAPFIYNQWTTEEEFMAKVKMAQNNFVNYFVYPIAISMPDADLYRGDRMTYLDSSSTLVLSSNSVADVIDKNYNFKAYHNVLARVNKDDIVTFYSENLYRDTAISIVAKEDYEVFKKSIDTFIDMGITFTYPEYLKSEISLGDNFIKNKKSGIEVNGKLIGVNNFISKEEFSSIFNTEVVKEENETINLDVFQNIVFIISLMALVIFIIFFIKNKKVDRRKYFK